MLRSMTGYGKSTVETDELNISVEIKTVNSKQMDLNCRLPFEYNPKEPEIRSLVSRSIQRGKVFVGITKESTAEHSGHSINQDLALNYYNELKELKEKMNQKAEPDYLLSIMRMPDILKTEEQEISEDEWMLLKKAIEETLDKVDEYRIEEGKILETDFQERIKNIQQYLNDIEPFEKERLEFVKTKFNKELSDFIKEKTIDENRYEQEVLYYLDKLDITEEKVRLKQHCTYFLETMDADMANGKKLNFIAQEMGREINTTGSKANHAEIQKIVVNMKDELEKIKEQLANIL
ncbi:MAG: YicC/YloC family endoribonuclease [Bacteroidota bacterium]